MPASKPAAGDAVRLPNTTGGQDAAVALATQIGLMVFGLLVQGMLAWMLLPEGRGSYAVCLVFASLFVLLFTPGAEQGAQYFLAARQLSVSQAVSSALAIALAGGGAAIALAIPLIGSGIPFFQKAAAAEFRLAAMLVPLIAFSAAIEHLLLAVRRFARVGIFVLLRAAGQGLAIVLLVWVLGLGIFGALLSFAAAQLVMAALCVRDLRRHCGLSLGIPTRAALARILGYGLKFHVARVGQGIELHLGILVLGLIGRPADIGLFAAASALMAGLTHFSSAVGNALLPRIADNEQPLLVARCVRVVGAVTAVALAALLALSTPVVRLVFSDAFLPAVPLLWILGPGILAAACMGIFMTHFRGIDRPEICSWAVGVGLLGNLGVLLVLYPLLGVRGAAWAMTVGMTFRLLLLAVSFRRTTRMGWRSVWMPQRSDALFFEKAARSLLGSKRPKSRRGGDAGALPAPLPPGGSTGVERRLRPGSGAPPNGGRGSS